MSDLQVGFVAIALAILGLCLVFLVGCLIAGLLEVIRSKSYQETARIRVMDPDRVEAHVTWPWHEDPIELEIVRSDPLEPEHRNGDGRAGEDLAAHYKEDHEQ